MIATRARGKNNSFQGNLVSTDIAEEIWSGRTTCKDTFLNKKFHIALEEGLGKQKMIVFENLEVVYKEIRCKR